RQPGIFRNSRKKAIGRLSGWYPPGNNRRHGSDQDKRQQFARDPAFDLMFGLPRRPRVTPDEIVPGEDPDNDRRPTVKRSLFVQPHPASEDRPIMAVHNSWQQKPAHQRITKCGEPQGKQGCELQPMARRRRSATGADRPLGRVDLSTAFAEEMIFNGSSYRAHGAHSWE